jgi:hypothetical protein
MADSTIKVYRRAVLEPRQSGLIARRYALPLAVPSAPPPQQIRHLEATVAGLQNEVRHWQSLIEEINRSASFRIGMKLTAPLRWVTRLASRR